MHGAQHLVRQLGLHGQHDAPAERSPSALSTADVEGSEKRGRGGGIILAPAAGAGRGAIGSLGGGMASDGSRAISSLMSFMASTDCRN